MANHDPFCQMRDEQHGIEDDPQERECRTELILVFQFMKGIDDDKWTSGYVKLMHDSPEEKKEKHQPIRKRSLLEIKKEEKEADKNDDASVDREENLSFHRNQFDKITHAKPKPNHKKNDEEMFPCDVLVMEDDDREGDKQCDKVQDGFGNIASLQKERKRHGKGRSGKPGDGLNDVAEKDDQYE